MYTGNTQNPFIALFEGERKEMKLFAKK